MYFLIDEDNNELKNEIKLNEEEDQEDNKQTLADENQQQLWLEHEKLQQFTSVIREQKQQGEDHIEVKSISEHEEEAVTSKHEQQKTEVQMDTLSIEEVIDHFN